MSAELKSCPMCGGAVEVLAMDDYFMAACECGVNYEGPTAEDCAEAWNRRDGVLAAAYDEGVREATKRKKFNTHYAGLRAVAAISTQDGGAQGQVIDGIFWPAGYCTDPTGKIVAPKGKHRDFEFGYNIGYAEGLVAIKDSVTAIGERAIERNRRTVEAQAADVDELPPLPEAFGTLENVDSEGHTIGWVGGYSADQMRDYARAALKGKP